jgi:hypothetical protein
MTDTITTTTTTTTTAPDIPDDVRAACAIARGEVEGPQEPIGREIAAEREERSGWVAILRRVRWIAAEGRWEPVTPYRLDDHGNDTIFEPFYAGDLVLVYYEGRAPWPEAELYYARQVSRYHPDVELAPHRVGCPITFRRDKRLGIRLPDGCEIIAPDPTR